MTKTMVAMLAVLTLSPAFADDLDPARARLAEIRANRAHETAAAAPAPAAEVAAPAPAASPATKASPAPAAPIVRGTGYPMKYSGIDMRKPLGPGRPELKTSGSFQYYHAKPFGDIPWRVIIEEHAYQTGDIIRGAKILKIDASHVTLTKDGDTWTLPTFMQ